MADNSKNPYIPKENLAEKGETVSITDKDGKKESFEVVEVTENANGKVTIIKAK